MGEIIQNSRVLRIANEISYGKNLVNWLVHMDDQLMMLIFLLLIHILQSSVLLVISFLNSPSSFLFSSTPFSWLFSHPLWPLHTLLLDYLFSFQYIDLSWSLILCPFSILFLGDLSNAHNFDEFQSKFFMFSRMCPLQFHIHFTTAS